jgi:hypothetical protein
MSNEITKTRVLSSLIWKFMECAGTQGIQFIVQIVLARLLLPEDYGIIALVIIFTSIAGVFVQSGLNRVEKSRLTSGEFAPANTGQNRVTLSRINTATALLMIMSPSKKLIGWRLSA